jgi:hypothetical protein
MASMLDYNKALRAMVAPAPVMVPFATHFDAHSASVVIAMHLASVSVTVITVAANADAHLFGARNCRDRNCNSCQGCNNVS